jgi:hypothetical protein
MKILQTQIRVMDLESMYLILYKIELVDLIVEHFQSLTVGCFFYQVKVKFSLCLTV